MICLLRRVDGSVPFLIGIAVFVLIIEQQRPTGVAIAMRVTGGSYA